MTPPGADRLRIGVAGWSYPDWRGTIYPLRRPAKFSELRFAARLFDCLEINSTFYRLPEARLAEGWLRQVEDIPGFVFTAKLFRELTHGRPTAESIRELCRTFREGLSPLVESERLGCVLIQFPWTFEDGPESRELLERLAESLGPLPLTVELRHRSFLDRDTGGGLPFLGRLGLGFVNIDLPRSRTSPPPSCINTTPVGYYRLHGRNTAAWFDPKADRDSKYSYLYSLSELRELMEPVQELARRTQVTYVITNNHFRGQAAANALQLIQLAGRTPSRIPETLQSEFPFLVAADRTEAS
ncbi:MAG: DUF72 domain-containing protein [Planctomycetota bacterium]|nr:DUF72 domain-containing protein [Planctomycetota bacterium]